MRSGACRSAHASISRSRSSSLTVLDLALAARARAELLEALLEATQALFELAILVLQLARAVAQRGVRLPPIDAHLLGLVDGGDEEPQLDREQLDVEQVDLDVARDDDALVEHALEDVGQVGG